MCYLVLSTCTSVLQPKVITPYTRCSSCYVYTTVSLPQSPISGCIVPHISTLVDISVAYISFFVSLSRAPWYLSLFLGLLNFCFLAPYFPLLLIRRDRIRAMISLFAILLFHQIFLNAHHFQYSRASRLYLGNLMWLMSPESFQMQ